MKDTIVNLAAAFIGESQARNRYSMYGKRALEDGFAQISEIFLLTSDQEKQHAKWLFTLINELKAKEPGKYDEIKLEAPVPTALGDTAENLKAAIAGENYEHTTMYPDFATAAEKEGLEDIAKRLRSIAIAEKHHEERYQKILEQVEKGTVHKKDEPTWWICMECGYMVYAVEPPEKCPSCDHERAYFQVKCEEY